MVMRIWSDSLNRMICKLAKYYELIIYTILPKEVMNQVYEFYPAIKKIISHTLCGEDIEYNEKEFSRLAVKDLNHFAENRKANIHSSDSSGDNQTETEIMVVDVNESEEVADSAISYIQG